VVLKLLTGLAAALLGLGLGHPPKPPPVAHPQTFTVAGRAAVSTLMRVYYDGNGAWRACNNLSCATGDHDWGYDSLTFALALRATTSSDPTPRLPLDALAADATTYGPPCSQASSCRIWSDTASWDAIALADDYQATNDPLALSKARAAFAYVALSPIFHGGNCPGVLYQAPAGGKYDLKTLETDANAVKAALLLYRATNDSSYLSWAQTAYAAIRQYYMDPQVPLYTVWILDNGQSCTPIPHRFFASVNGDMIWDGVELYHDTGDHSYLDQANATASAVQQHLADGRGVFADLQAENDVVEPMVEGMYALAQTGSSLARSWVIKNATAALSARAPDGAFGRFFDGPPPATTVTAWQTNGGLALEIAAAALAPHAFARPPSGWSGASVVAHDISSLPASLTFTGSGIALLGTLGEQCCSHGHAQVLIDGTETFDQTGIWQNKSSGNITIPDTVLFAWRWPSAGTHTLSFLPGVANPKEGGSFLHLVGYDLTR